MKFFKKNYIVFVIQLIVFTCFFVSANAAGSENSYVLTDRTTYIAGESVFYKLYVLDTKTKKRSEISKVGYIVVRAANSDPVLKYRVKVDSGIANGCIALPDTLSSGVYQIVAYTGIMKNYGEKHFFHKEIVITNRFDKQLNFKLLNPMAHVNDSSASKIPLLISVVKPVFGLREKVKVSLGKTGFKANMAVSVFEESGMLPKDKSIVEILEGFYNDSVYRNVPYKYLPETKGKVLRGRVIDATTQECIPSATVLLSCLDTIANLQYAATDPNGMFQMLLENYYNGKELFFTIWDMPAGKNWKIEIEDEFAMAEKWNPTLSNNDGSSKEYIVRSQNIVYINQSYKLNNDVKESIKPDEMSICPKLYHTNATTILPSDFVPLNDFLEISVEILPMVKIFKHKDKYSAHIVNATSNLFDDKGPALFLDGVYVDDINKILVLGSEKIKKIDVIDAERVFGNLVFQGVISITTKSKEILNTIPASNSLRLKNDKYNSTDSFVTVNPDSMQNKNIPFFKQLLYWNPNMELNVSGNTEFEFYTSDNTGTYIIMVEGISEDGIPVSSSYSIQVINKTNVTDK